MHRVILCLLPALAACEPPPLPLGEDPFSEDTGASSGSETETAAPSLETIQTATFPNGIAADEQYIYVAIGEPHSSPDSLPIPRGTTSAVQVFSTADGSLVTEIEVAGGGHSMRMTPDGSKLYLAHFSLDNRVTAISTRDLQTVAEVGGLTQLDIVVPDALSISPDGRWVYVGSNGLRSGWVSRIDTATDEVDRDWRVPVEGGFTCWVEASPREGVLYANSWTGGTVQRQEIATQTTTDVVAVGAFPHAVATDPSGAFVYAMVSGGNRVLKLDGETLETITEIEGPWAGFWGGPVGATRSHSGRYLFVANHALGKIAILDIDPDSPSYDTVVGTAPVGDDPIFSALSPDGTRLYVADNASATITVLDVSAWE